MKEKTGCMDLKECLIEETVLSVCKQGVLQEKKMWWSNGEVTGKSRSNGKLRRKIEKQRLFKLWELPIKEVQERMQMYENRRANIVADGDVRLEVVWRARRYLGREISISG